MVTSMSIGLEITGSALRLIREKSPHVVPTKTEQLLHLLVIKRLQFI